MNIDRVPSSCLIIQLVGPFALRANFGGNGSWFSAYSLPWMSSEEGPVSLSINTSSLSWMSGEEEPLSLSVPPYLG